MAPEHAGTITKAKKKRKLHITFDEDKRKEYLTGFSKRKQARRRFGHDMEAFKVRKKQLEEKKQKNQQKVELLAKLDDMNEESDHDNESLKKDLVTMKFDDPHTFDKFGEAVTVTTVLGSPTSDTEDDVSDPDDIEAELLASKKRYHSDKQMTLFQRIQFKRRGKALPTRRGKLKQVKQAAKHFNRQKKSDDSSKNKKGGKRNKPRST